MGVSGNQETITSGIFFGLESIVDLWKRDKNKIIQDGLVLEDYSEKKTVIVCLHAYGPVLLKAVIASLLH